MLFVCSRINWALSYLFTCLCWKSYTSILANLQKRVSIIASNYEQQTLDEIQSFRSSHLNDHIVAPLHNTIKKLFSRFVHLVLQGGFWLLSSQQLQLKHETWLKGCFPSLHTRRISAPSPMIITFHICQSVPIQNHNSTSHLYKYLPIYPVTTWKQTFRTCFFHGVPIRFPFLVSPTTKSWFLPSWLKLSPSSWAVICLNTVGWSIRNPISTLSE